MWPENYNFSEVGISQNNLSLSYVYRLQLSETNYLYPNVSVNYYSPGQLSNLLFEDQILFGGISSDILASNYNQKHYFGVDMDLCLDQCHNWSTFNKQFIKSKNYR